MITKVYGTLLLIVIDTIKEDDTYLMPQQDVEDALSGIVSYIGDDITSTSVGDKVVFGQYDYKKQVIEGIEYAVVKEEGLICKLKRNE